MPRLAFIPARHGFHFRNLFVNHPSPGITTLGLCGGMALAAARYWMHKLPIPTHVEADFPDGSPAGVPPPGSPLHDYIYQCQLGSYGPTIAGIVNWFTLPWVTFDDQFNWSVEQFDNVRRRIDAGAPVVIGLRLRTDNPFGHQVLAYGYDADSRTLYLYDSNNPDRETTLTLDMKARRIRYDGEISDWSSFFVTDCPMEGDRPPYVDLGLCAGITVRAADPAPLGGQVSIEVTVRNFGFRDAHVQALYVYTRGPRGENLDDLMGGSDGDGSPIPPGGERRITRRCKSFGSAPGAYQIGVSYLSQQGCWVPIPAVSGGTRAEVTVRVADLKAPAALPWRSLGGVLAGPPAAQANADGRLEVFGRGLDNRIWRMAEIDPGGEAFTGWELLPGDQTFSGQPVAVCNHWKKLEVFARGRDGGLWHRWQNEPCARSAAQWSGWTPKGGALEGDPTVAKNHDDRLEVFAVHTDGRAYHIYQRWFDAFGAPWSGWEPLGVRRFSGRIAAHRDGAGRLWAYGRGRDDGSIWSCHQTLRSGPWTDWAFTGGYGDEPALGVNPDGRLEAFVRGGDGKVWHQWQTAADADFSGWQLLHDFGPTVPVLDVRGRPTVWTQPNGHMAAAAVESDREAFVIGRIDTAPWWSDFQLAGSEVSGEIAAAAGGGVSALFALGPAQDLRVALRR